MFGDLEVMSTLEFYQYNIVPSSIVDQTFIVWIQPLQQYNFSGIKIQEYIYSVSREKCKMQQGRNEC